MSVKIFQKRERSGWTRRLKKIFPERVRLLLGL